MILLRGPSLLLGRPYYEPLLWFMIFTKVFVHMEERVKHINLASFISVTIRCVVCITVDKIISLLFKDFNDLQ